jgi:hypothetical protein
MPLSPSIVPSGEDQDVYLLLDQFGRQLGRAWRETDEADTDFETLIRHLLEGQYSNPVRVVAFNTAQGWSRDVSDDVADELRQRCADRNEAPAFLADFLERYDTGKPVQLLLPIVVQ